MPEAKVPVKTTEMPKVGDHPVLDFLNTVVRVDGELVDLFQSDSDVRHWLARAGFKADTAAATKLKPTDLLETARTLRLAIRTELERRKRGEQNPSILNAFFSLTRSYPMMVPDKDGRLRLERRWDWERLTPEQMLAPLMESVADLLVTGDFERIKHCENKECVLWFYDRTRSHHRRWCSPAMCGNRHKVASFRKRRESGSEARSAEVSTGRKIV